MLEEASMRSGLIVVALSLFVAGQAVAGGLHARIEGPAADGVTYTAHMISCDAYAVLEPWALAEGVVNGKRQSYLIRLEPAGEHGTYRFKRTWPKEGEWMIRLVPGAPGTPTTVAALNHDGSIRDNQLYFDTDGAKECWKELRKYLSSPDDDNC
jgi:hypothetical protein